MKSQPELLVTNHFVYVCVSIQYKLPEKVFSKKTISIKEIKLLRNAAVVPTIFRLDLIDQICGDDEFFVGPWGGIINIH